MFLSNQYVLANELVQYMDIHIANVSKVINDLELAGDCSTIVKINSYTFIRDSNNLPNNFRQALRTGFYENRFTDVSKMVPSTWLRTELDVTPKELVDAGIAKSVLVAGKPMVEFTEEMYLKLRRSVPYILNAAETEECFNNKQIDGYVQLKKNKFLTWYKKYA